VDAISIIKTVIALGTTVKDAVDSSHQSNGSIDWGGVVKSVMNDPTTSADIKALLASLAGKDYEAAIQTVLDKQNALRDGRPLAQLSDDELDRYDDLADARLILATGYLKGALDQNVAQWLVQTALPTLLSALPVLVTALL